MQRVKTNEVENPVRTFVIRFGKLVKNKKILIVSVQSILLRVSV